MIFENNHRIRVPRGNTLLLYLGNGLVYANYLRIISIHRYNLMTDTTNKKYISIYRDLQRIHDLGFLFFRYYIIGIILHISITFY